MTEPYPKCQHCGHSWHGLRCTRFVGRGDKSGLGSPGDKCSCETSFEAP